MFQIINPNTSTALFHRYRKGCNDRYEKYHFNNIGHGLTVRGARTDHAFLTQSLATGSKRSPLKIGWRIPSAWALCMYLTIRTRLGESHMAVWL